jgi:hypothetical protein
MRAGARRHKHFDLNALTADLPGKIGQWKDAGGDQQPTACGCRSGSATASRQD